MSSFEVIDRRGSNKKEEPAPVKVDVRVSEGSTEWLETAYIIVPGVQTPFGVWSMGRSVGRRMDGQGPFVADYLFGPIWKEDEVWQPHAKERLDTFLGCDCRSGKQGGICVVHKMLLEQWTVADKQRIELMCSSPLPPVLESLMRAEHNIQGRKIAVP